MKSCVYGGSFNPPTISHLFVITYLAAKFDQVIIVPCYQHVFGKELIKYHHRHHMLELMIEPWTLMGKYIEDHSLDIAQSLYNNFPEVFVSCIEENLGGESIMARTIENLSDPASLNMYGKLYFALGEDAYRDIDKWKDKDKLLSLAEPYVLDQNLFPNIHSTQIREWLKISKVTSNYRTDKLTAKKYLPNSTYEYIMENDLYL